MAVTRGRYYFQSHATKSEYNKAFRDAKLWCIAHPTESHSKVARQFDIKANSLRKATSREEAIRQYCYDQWEVDMGATHLMVKSAITHLLAAQTPPKPPPSKTWFRNWLKDHPELHSIKTKPMEAIRSEPHTEEVVIQWFQNLEREMERLQINDGKKVLNMDESGIRGALPYAESVVVPRRSRKTVTIIETIRGDGKKTLPAFVICPGEMIMENWISINLSGEETITFSSTGYINNSIIMEYAYYLIKHSHAGPEKPWKLLLLDGHESHYYKQFIVLLQENHIYPWYFPSHLTHALQPLDNAFKNAGIWPLSYKAGLKRIRSFGKQKLIEELELPLLLPSTLVDRVISTVTIVESFIGRDLTHLSDDLREIFQSSIKEAVVQLYKALITSTDNTILQQKLQSSAQEKKTSRRSIKQSKSIGGAIASVADLRLQIQAKAEAEKTENRRRADRVLSHTIGKYKKSLLKAGV
ncbi:uncharacterized protein RAG0_14759 [Rhynchosporium agropyri]|uniref:DDE-1 domain-containing protein n=1 Tax=Rhynchosporium agropyri TaxID=914238 RepID=A0A1E1LIB3_9HELO|nr:uncharacterized protein RAG0_14759 [Rhynchosporium agropyri]